MAMTFDALACARKLEDAGFTRNEAETQPQDLRGFLIGEMKPREVNWPQMAIFRMSV